MLIRGTALPHHVRSMCIGDDIEKRTGHVAIEVYSAVFQFKPPHILTVHECHAQYKGEEQAQSKESFIRPLIGHMGNMHGNTGQENEQGAGKENTGDAELHPVTGTLTYNIGAGKSRKHHGHGGYTQPHTKALRLLMVQIRHLSFITVLYYQRHFLQFVYYICQQYYRQVYEGCKHQFPGAAIAKVNAKLNALHKE